MREIFDLCKKIGIITFGDLQRFKRENMVNGEDIVIALKRHLIEIGGKL